MLLGCSQVIYERNKMSHKDFTEFARKVADALGTHAGITNPYTILSVANDLYVESAAPVNSHEGRVAVCLGSPTIINFMQDGKKIHAIKELRQITGCGLREAKDAVEDYRVYRYWRPAY